MKAIYTLILILNVCSLSAQFKFTKDGLTDFVVHEKEVNAMDWIMDNHTSPQILVDQYDRIRFVGFRDKSLCLSQGLCYPCRYQIEIGFKDGKYKFDPVALEYDHPQRGTVMIDLNNGDQFYKPNGKEYSAFRFFREDIERLFNELDNSLMNYKKDDW